MAAWFVEQPALALPQPPMATPCVAVDSREVLRCFRCLLVQYVTHDGKCRRCHLSLDEPPAPEPPPEPPAAIVPQQATNLAASLAQNLRAARLRLGLSQRELAARLGSPRTYISKLEQLPPRVRPTIGNLYRLATALETTALALLFSGEGTRQQEVDELLTDPFIAELQPLAARLSPLQIRAVIAQVFQMTLRRGA